MVNVLVVLCVMRKNDRNPELRPNTQRRIAEQERMVRMDDVRCKFLDRSMGSDWNGQWEREIRSSEMLDRGNSQHVFCRLGAGKHGTHDLHLMSEGSILIRKRINTSRDTTDVRREGVGHHEYLHRETFLLESPERRLAKQWTCQSGSGCFHDSPGVAGSHIRHSKSQI